MGVLRSCETQLPDMVSNLDRALNRVHKQTGVIIMYFVNAFGKVPHSREAIVQTRILRD